MRLSLAVPIVTLALVAFAFAARAQASSTGTPDEAAPRTPQQLQLASLMVPVRWANGRLGVKAMTPVLDLDGEDLVAPVCWLVPRIRDAVIVTLHKEPIPGGSHGEFDFADVTNRLTQAVNAALGEAKVSGVSLVPGTRPTAVSARFARTVQCGKRREKKNEAKGDH